MNVAEFLYKRMDLLVAQRIFFFAGAAVLALIPVDGYLVRVAVMQTGISTPQKTVRQDLNENLPARAEYLKEFDRNTIFGMQNQSVNMAVVKVSLAELVKDIRLKGVVFLSTPEAIIEDAKTQKTQFVKEGAHLGEVSIKEIKEGYVVLSYLGEDIKIELQS